MSLGLREYARHRKAAGLPGGSLRAVQVAIRDGRLKGSVTRTGKIRSAKEADREWLASTHADMVPGSGPTAPKTRRSPTGSAPTETVTAEADSPIAPPVNELGAARARRESAVAQLAEIELAEKRGELLEAKDVEAVWADHLLRARARLLAIPSRLREQAPEVGDVAIKLLTGLIDEALEELAGEQP